MTKIKTEYSWAESLFRSGLNESKRLAGYYNHNYLVENNGNSYLIRIPISNSDTMDIKRIPEAEVLSYIEKSGFEAPRLLYTADHDEFYIHSAISGINFNDKYPGSSPLPDWVPIEIAERMAMLHSIDPSPLASYCRDLGASPNTREFFLAHYSFDVSVFKALNPLMAEIYARLAIPRSPFQRLNLLANEITERQFVLCHSDIHRKNILISGSDNTLTLLDWELALVGDPVYDIAVHFHKMRYGADQEDLFIQKYAFHSESSLAPGMIRRQVDAYLQLERVKSAIIDAFRVGTDLKVGGLSKEAAKTAAAGYGIKLAKARTVWGLPDDRILTSAENILNTLMLPSG